MILSDKTIGSLLLSKDLIIDPFEDSQIQPGSVDLRLGYGFLRPKTAGRPMRLDEPFSYENVPDNDKGEVIIMPGEFMLATTLEWVELPHNMTAFVEGRSSVGRIGLTVQNAGWVDPGFRGTITLELKNDNVNPIVLVPETRVCQLVFAQLDRDARVPYRGKYQGQRGTTRSMLYRDKEEK